MNTWQSLMIQELLEMSEQHGTKYFGSTSTLTKALSQIYFAISGEFITSVRIPWTDSKVANRFHSRTSARNSLKAYVSRHRVTYY